MSRLCCRVLLISLSAGRIVSQEVRHFQVSTDTRLGPGEQLFTFLADCIRIFLTDLGLLEETLSLGFTFSFPMIQDKCCNGSYFIQNNN